jgi:hypothetical protein
MNLVRTLAAAAAAVGVTLASQTLAQTPDEQMVTLVQAWIAEEAADLPPAVQEYAVACFTPEFQALAEPLKQIILTAGGIEAGVRQIEIVDPAAYALMFPVAPPNSAIQQCVETSLVGGVVWPWVLQIQPNDTPDEQKVATFCILEAIKPLTTEQKQELYIAAIATDADFEDGLDALVTAFPETEAMLQAGIEPCV